jgi:glutamate-1-semialdehyde 2,1-aminomutase
MDEVIGLYAAGAGALLYGLARAKSRMELSLAKHRSLAGHPRIARRLAGLLPNYQYEAREALAIDEAPEEVVTLRETAFANLAREFESRYPKSAGLSREMEPRISDMRFVSAYRVPYQFRRLAGERLKVGSFVASSAGVTVTDLDGNVFYDLTGSYGVNLYGNDFYKACIAEGSEIVKDLGPVLGAYHPVVADNVRRLRQISGMDEISFHMSGTEAVMQAVRLARYHTGRSHLVRFCGAYHGWWGDVQPGIGNPSRARETYTLKDMDEATLRVLRRRRDIACVLVNPLQALHPNRNAPGDSALTDGSRAAGYDRAAYTHWLHELRDVCSRRGIAFIIDEVFVGFRIAPGGAQEYFGVQADLVTYGKTLGGGLPVGVLCGRSAWMKRYREETPGDICFARGTFNTHPYVMGAMNAFLRRADTESMRALCRGQEDVWNRRAHQLNRELQEAGVPVAVANLSSIWTVLYTQPGCYHWLFQYYLRLEGIALSWVGTGRLIFSTNFSDAEFGEVARRFVAAAMAMQRDGWWWRGETLTDKAIRRRLLLEMLTHRFGREERLSH